MFYSLLPYFHMNKLRLHHLAHFKGKGRQLIERQNGASDEWIFEFCIYIDKSGDLISKETKNFGSAVYGTRSVSSRRVLRILFPDFEEERGSFHECTVRYMIQRILGDTYKKQWQLRFDEKRYANL